ncbi:glycosyltransferase family 2 protein [Leptolyngbya sp. FACHB-321]|uniref:glycosyltransferase family 2 protein n=1 Tax=Leptolyngbya sp. FACHB-321 TaxID=2692807 RepID=UPI001689AB0D|nr:glycosyltransferase family 2 protein [Leptolyngbya sp. FACHB-321]MBD2037929.1 glycosyltransferase family 2 protein [Leptolyngbya sp. FACHB-321]
MTLNKSVFILIPVHNRKTITLACLEALEKNSYLERYQAVVIDDGSVDNTGQAIRATYPDVTVLEGNGNLWWTGAIALGMQYAYKQGAEFFIWLNDDCQFAADTLSHLVNFGQLHPSSIIGCQGFEAGKAGVIAFGGKRKTWQGYRFLEAAIGQVIPCDLLSGNIVCIPRAVVETIGYPDPKLVPHYGGDSLFLIRAKKAGFPLFVDATTTVFNLPGESALYPTHWLLQPGDPLKLLKLVFVPQSGLSWRVWLRLNWEAYSLWGIVMFLKKYSSILLITLLRFLPLSLRQQFSKLTSAHEPNN